MSAQPRPAPVETCPYAVCDGGGWIYDEAANAAKRCRCQRERRAARRAAGVRRRLPERYRGLGFDRHPVTEIAQHYPEEVRKVRRYATTLGERLAAGSGIGFIGGPGTGKTTLAYTVLTLALDERHTVAHYSMPALLADIRKTFDDSTLRRRGVTYPELIDRLTTVDLLLIDDLGAERTTDWASEQLYSIVNARYEDQRALLYTSNLMPDEDGLAPRIGERTTSRLREMSEVLPFRGPDRRPLRDLDAEPRSGTGRRT